MNEEEFARRINRFVWKYTARRIALEENRGCEMLDRQRDAREISEEEYYQSIKEDAEHFMKKREEARNDYVRLLNSLR